MKSYKEKFDLLLGVKQEPSHHEKSLLEKGQLYITKLSKIPGIEMIAIVNSLSMYATHRDSDIDLFIITKPSMIWFVRFFATLLLWQRGVWRKNDAIAGNFCLSFFITTKALDLSKIAIENDIYLYYWIYYLKPIFIKDSMYEDFLTCNHWVYVDTKQKKENLRYVVRHVAEESYKIKYPLYLTIDHIIRLFLHPRTQRNHQKLGYPKGVVITDSMLKFHDSDKREIIRDTILENNFDK